MRRGYTREAYLDLVSHAKQVVPGIQFSGDIVRFFNGNENYKTFLIINDCFIDSRLLRRD